jgi:hypothetical protein
VVSRDAKEHDLLDLVDCRLEPVAVELATNVPDSRPLRLRNGIVGVVDGRFVTELEKPGGL